MKEGYIVLGFGESYVDECQKISQTIRVFDRDRKICIITQEKDKSYAESKNIFDKVICVDKEDIEDPNPHNSFCVKARVHVPKYSPFQKGITLDSDMICIHDPQHMWDFFNQQNVPFSCCGYEYESCWHWGKVEAICKKVGKKIPSIHGGVLYFNKSHKDIKGFYDECLDALNKYDEYGCRREFRGGMTDEAIFSIAMAKLNISPLHYQEYPIVSFNLPITIKLPCYIQSRNGEDIQKHIPTKYPTIFNHLFFHEKSMSKRRQIKLEGWYNAFHAKIINMNKHE